MAKGMHYTKVFRGLKYLYKMTFDQKRKAKMFADSYRRAEYLVRIVKTLDGYHVYARKKSTPSWA